MVRRRQLMAMQSGGLPGEYRHVAYLESTGGQYIATDYIPTADETSTEFIYQTTIRRSGDDMIYGMSTGSVAFYAEEYNQSHWYAAIGLTRYSNVQWSGYSDNTYKTYTLLGLDKINVTNLETGVSHSGDPTGSYPSFENTLKMYIFAWNNQGTAHYRHHGLRLFSLKLYRANKLSANYVPCIRKSDNKPGMYDTVSKTFYTNAGTGEFIVPN